jgi:hypothetical protein
MTLALARLAADAVLYEGYLLYPYRSTAAKNQVRWQFGVLSPPGAAAAGVGEEADLAVQCLLRVPVAEEGETGPPTVTVHLRFLQLQRRVAERQEADGSYRGVPELLSGGSVWSSWDEAVEVERELGTFGVQELRDGRELAVEIPGGEAVEPIPGGRLVRRRWPLRADVSLLAHEDGGLLRIELAVRNTADPVTEKDASLRASLIGAHLLLSTDHARFVSVIDPPEDARDAADRCRQHRCWPVLAGDGGPDGQTSDVVLASPIILYDHPAVAPESAGAMFDSTEIDEILTLRVLTLTDEEKAQARATDAHAAAIIDRCERLSPAELERLHGILREPHAAGPDPTRPQPTGPGGTGDDWWVAEAAAEVTAETDSVLIGGTRVARGSRVRLRPSRRADAQDMFLAGQEARVSAVHVDLDGETYVAVTLTDDPAAELHDWYGRYLYFAPEELEPLPEAGDGDEREESEPCGPSES